MDIPQHLLDADLGSLTIVELRKLQHALGRQINRLTMARTAMEESMRNNSMGKYRVRGGAGDPTLNTDDNWERLAGYPSSRGPDAEFETESLAEQQSTVATLDLLLSRLVEQKRLANIEESVRRASKHDGVEEKQIGREIEVDKKSTTQQKEHIQRADAIRGEVVQQFRTRNEKHNDRVVQAVKDKDQRFEQRFNQLEEKIKESDRRAEMRKKAAAEEKAARYARYLEKQKQVVERMEEHQTKRQSVIEKAQDRVKRAGTMATKLKEIEGVRRAEEGFRIAARRQSLSVARFEAEGGDTTGKEKPLTTAEHLEQKMLMAPRSKSSLATVHRPPPRTSTSSPTKASTKLPPGMTAAGMARLTKAPAPRGMELHEKLQVADKERAKEIKRYKDTTQRNVAEKNDKRLNQWESNNRKLEKAFTDKFDDFQHQKEAENMRMKSLQQAQDATILSLARDRDDKRKRVLKSAAAPLPPVDRWASRARGIVHAVCGDLAKTKGPVGGTVAMAAARQPQSGFEQSSDFAS